MGVNVGIVCVCFVLFMAIEAIEIVPKAAQMDSILENKNIFKRKRSRPPSRSRPIDYTFKLPTEPTSWPEGNGFAGGILDLGGLQVSQASTFRKVWGAYDGGPDNQGTSVYEPIGIPEGFSMLGSYSQPNNKPLFGYVLVAKDVSSSTSNGTLKPPVDYTILSNTASVTANQDSTLYIWLPVPPDGYKALGHVVTTTPDKPPLDKIMCVRSDLTNQCELTSWIWGSNDFNFYDGRPINRGAQAPDVRVGTFIAQNGGTINPPSVLLKSSGNFGTPLLPLSCYESGVGKNLPLVGKWLGVYF